MIKEEEPKLREETRHITRKLLLFLNVTLAFSALCLKVIDRIVVAYTEEIERADILNFTIFSPILIFLASVAVYRALRPVRELAGAYPDLSPEQLQRLRTAAFNIPLKVLLLVDVIILSGVAFVALGVDAVVFKFYPFYKRLISMFLIWSFVISVSLAVFIYTRRLMLPILRRTSGAAPDKGRRLSITVKGVAATLTLTAMVFLFLSVYAFSKVREFPGVPDSEIRGTVLFLIVIGLFFVTLSSVIAYYVASDTSFSIKSIAGRMGRLSKEEETLFEEIEVTSLDEVGELTTEFNSLQRTVRANRQRLDEANKKLLEMERRQAREALEESEKRYRLLAENVTDVIWTMNMDLRFTYVSPSIKQLLGYTVDEVMAHRLEDRLTPRSFKLAIETYIEEMAVEAMEHKDTSRSVTLELESVRKDGSLVATEARMTFLRDPDGKPVGILGVSRDISERRGLEEQLRHSQKMEAIGTLTGGIAHDFNNILAAVAIYSTLLSDIVKDNETAGHYVDQILASVAKAASLTRGLLAFSRKQIISQVPVDINGIIENMKGLLSRLIGEDIELRTSLAREGIVIRADSGQIEQVLMNLATNARDAMPQGGALSVSTRAVEMDWEFVKTHGYGKPGTYARITFSDTGTGMDDETRQRIFEPFFTTKEVGKGTGLGLSMVFGIVQQHDGYIECSSVPGKGATFRIFLPALKTDVAAERPTDRFLAAERGKETLLLAEDDPGVRKSMKNLLEASGYEVITAIDGEDAIEKYGESGGNVDLLIFDVIMPRKNGKEAYDIIRKIRPDIKVLFISGYTADIIGKKGIEAEGLNFISKPPLPAELLKKIRETLTA